MSIQGRPSADHAACLDIPRQQGSSRVGKRFPVPRTQGANSGVGERLCQLRKGAGFILLPAVAKALGVSVDELYGRTPAKKRQVPQLIDAFIEGGQLKRKLESRA